MSVGKKNCRLRLLIYSIGLTTSLAAGHVAGNFAISSVADVSIIWLIGFMVGPLVTGILVGLNQWFLLRRKIPRVDRWLLVSSLGWTAGSVLFNLIDNAVFGTVNLALFGKVDLAAVWTASSVIGGVAGGVVGGGSLGIIQWIVLKGEISRAGKWILASSLAWAASNGVIGCFDLAAIGIMSLVLVWFINGAIYGVFTGKVLLQLS
jgi:hypothetical protein